MERAQKNSKKPPIPDDAVWRLRVASVFLAISVVILIAIPVATLLKAID